MMYEVEREQRRGKKKKKEKKKGSGPNSTLEGSETCRRNERVGSKQNGPKVKMGRSWRSDYTSMERTTWTHCWFPENAPSLRDVRLATLPNSNRTSDCFQSPPTPLDADLIL